MNKADLPPLTLIAGPTASGKSALALELAAERPSVIVNADAMQVYANLRILTARPGVEEEAAVPHRLYGTVEGATAFSSAAWAEAAKTVLHEAWAAELRPILVGGTGLYVMTLLDGIAPVPAIEQQTREAVRALPVAEAHATLSIEDPAMAARLNANDSTRVARALEVIRGTGMSLARWQERREGGIREQVALDPFIVEAPRDMLFARAERRADTMLATGAIDEVTRLMARELDPALPVMRAIGVPPIARFLRAEIDLDAVRAALIADTQGYIKRQITWIKGQFPSHWPRVPIQDI